MNLSLGILFGLLSMVGFGLSNALSQPLTRKIGSSKTLFLRNLFIVPFMLAVFLIFPAQQSYDISFFAIAFGLGILGFVPTLAFYKAVKIEKVGVVAPVASSQVVIAVLLAMLFFNETLSATQLASIVLIIAGVLLISFNPKDWKNLLGAGLSLGVLFALVASVLWGLVFFLLKIPVNAIGPILTSLLLEFGVLLASGAYLWHSKPRFKMPDNGALLLVFAVAATGAVGTLFFNFGVQISAVSIVAALSMSSSLVATLYGRFVFNERLSRLQWLSVGLIISGIVFLQLLG
jgi:drug/metabolite transporter (DMT)-like permease